MRRFNRILIALCAVMSLIAIPGRAASEKGPRCSDGIDNDGDFMIDCADPDCNCSSGQTSDVIYKVDVVADTNFSNADSPMYLPTCSAETRDQSGPGVTFNAWFPRHDSCATVTTSTGYQLTDDISFLVNQDSSGNIVSLTLRGQDVIGMEGIAHESEEVIPVNAPIVPLDSGFVIHVHRDHLPIWKLSKHRGGKRVEIVGEVSLGDLIYSPNP